MVKTADKRRGTNCNSAVDLPELTGAAVLAVEGFVGAVVVTGAEGAAVPGFSVIKIHGINVSYFHTKQ